MSHLRLNTSLNAPHGTTEHNVGYIASRTIRDGRELHCSLLQPVKPFRTPQEAYDWADACVNNFMLSVRQCTKKHKVNLPHNLSNSSAKKKCTRSLIFGYVIANISKYWSPKFHSVLAQNTGVRIYQKFGARFLGSPCSMNRYMARLHVRDSAEV